jgi:hypothetical protein
MFWVLDFHPNRAQEGRSLESGPLGPGNAYIFIGVSTDVPQGRQAVVGDTFGHPGVRVKAANSRFLGPSSGQLSI